NNHRGLGAALAVVVLLLAAPAEGKVARKSRSAVAAMCTAAYDDSLRLRADGQLLAARDKLVMCARPACGAVQRRCASELMQVEADLAWIVPVASDDGGQSLVETTVRMDGRPLLLRVDGRSVTVDPGMHEFTFETAGAPPATLRALIPLGGRNRPIAAVLHVP